jgi:hypothetical protein
VKAGGGSSDVTVESSSNISTAGVDAHGLFAQSLAAAVDRAASLSQVQ